MLSKVLQKVLRKNQFKKNFFVRQPNVQQPLQEMAKFCCKFKFTFRKKYYLSRKNAVPKFATSCSGETLYVSCYDHKNRRK